MCNLDQMLRFIIYALIIAAMLFLLFGRKCGLLGCREGLNALDDSMRIAAGGGRSLRTSIGPYEGPDNYDPTRGFVV